MKPKGRTVLIELLIAFLFFSLSAVIILQLFSGGYRFVKQSGDRADALREAQSLADRLYAADDATDFLLSEGFGLSDGVYERTADNITYRVALETIESSVGVTTGAVVTALDGAKELLSLPVKRYEGRPTP